jgi:hypothetical protein
MRPIRPLLHPKMLDCRQVPKLLQLRPRVISWRRYDHSPCRQNLSGSTTVPSSYLPISCPPRYLQSLVPQNPDWTDLLPASVQAWVPPPISLRPSLRLVKIFWRCSRKLQRIELKIATLATTITVLCPAKRFSADPSGPAAFSLGLTALILMRKSSI